MKRARQVAVEESLGRGAIRLRHPDVAGSIARRVIGCEREAIADAFLGMPDEPPQASLITTGNDLLADVCAP